MNEPVSKDGIGVTITPQSLNCFPSLLASRGPKDTPTEGLVENGEMGIRIKWIG
jgi:hypothetical protein